MQRELQATQWSKERTPTMHRAETNKIASSSNIAKLRGEHITRVSPHMLAVTERPIIAALLKHWGSGF